MLPPSKNDAFFEFSEKIIYIIACGDMDLLHKSTGGSKPPPYDISSLNYNLIYSIISRRKRNYKIFPVEVREKLCYSKSNKNLKRSVFS